MSKVKYILLVVFVLIIALFGIVFSGNNPLLYWDVPTLLFVPILPWLITCFIHSFKDQGEYLKMVLSEDNDKDILKRALLYFNLIRNLTIASAILACFTGFIGVLANLDDITIVGRNCGVVVITIYYTALYLLVVIEPLRGVTKKKLN